jgi:hypothetical protein
VAQEPRSFAAEVRQVELRRPAEQGRRRRQLVQPEADRSRQEPTEPNPKRGQSPKSPCSKIRQRSSYQRENNLSQLVKDCKKNST